MIQRNCPNCGAPLEIDRVCCPYCNTSYFDLTAVNMASREPFYIKVRTEANGKPCVLTAKVVPDLFTVESVCETKTARGGLGDQPIFVFMASRGVGFSLNLKVVENEKGELFTMEMEG